MGMDLIVSSEKELIIASNEAFPAELLRVEFYADTKLFVMVFDETDSDGMLLDHEIPDDFLLHINNAATITAIYYKDDKPVEGYKVPLIQLGNI